MLVYDLTHSEVIIDVLTGFLRLLLFSFWHNSGHWVKNRNVFLNSCLHGVYDDIVLEFWYHFLFGV